MSPDRVDVQRMLERMAAADAPPTRPAFVAELETRLRRAADETGTDPIAGDPTRDNRYRLLPARRPAFLGGAAAAAIALLVAAVAVFGGSGEDPDNDRVATRPTAAPTTEPTLSPVAPSPTVTAAPAGADQVTVPPTVPAAPATTTRSPATTSSPTTQPSTQTMALTAERDLDGVHLSWTTYTGPDFAAYVCLRAEGDNRPTYPPDANTRAVWQESDQAEDYYLDWRAPPGKVSYLMVAIDSSGRELARSNVVSLPALSPSYDDSPLTS